MVIPEDSQCRNCIHWLKVEFRDVFIGDTSTELLSCFCSLKGTVLQKSMWALIFFFLRKQQWYHLFDCETHAYRAITAQSPDYLVYLRDLAVHKDHLPHQMMTSQSAFKYYDVI